MAVRAIQYTVRVDMHEVKDLVLHEGNKELLPNMYIEVCFNEVVKTTQVYNQLCNGMINESFNITASLTAEEFNKAVIYINCIHKYIIQTTLIGSYAFSLKYIYSKPQHWIYRQWVKLLNPESPSLNVGIFLLTVGVFGPGDSVPVIDESLSTITEGDANRINSGPNLIVTFYNLAVTIHKAQDIPLLTGISNTVEPYVVVKHGPARERTKTIRDQNPEWNTTIRLPSIYPCHDGNVIIELWNGDTNSLLINIVVLDFFDLIKNELSARWFNFYWRAPTEGVFGAVQNMIGSAEQREPNAYGGRVLISASATKVQVPHTKGSVPCRVMSDPPNLEYKLSMELYETISHTYEGTKIRIELNVGHHSLYSLPLLPNELGSYLVDQISGSLEDLQLYLPENEDSEWWDVFLYLLVNTSTTSAAAAAVSWLGGVSLAGLTGQNIGLNIPSLGLTGTSTQASPQTPTNSLLTGWERVAWTRTPLKYFMTTRGKPIWFTLESTQTSNAATLLLSISIYPTSANILRPPRLIYTLERFYFRAFVYEGLHLPTLGADLFPNPYIKVNLSGHTIRTSTIKQTINPSFYEAYEIELFLPANINLAPDIQVEICSENKSLVGGDTNLGGFRYKITKVPVEWKRAPEWIEVSSHTYHLCKSKALMAFELIPAEKVEDDTYPFFDDIRPSIVNATIAIMLIGIRMFRPLNSPSITVSFGRDVDDSSQPLWSETLDKPISGFGGNYNFMKQFYVDVSLPKRVQHNSFLEVKIVNKSEQTAFSNTSYTTQGMAYIPLNNLFPWLSDIEKKLCTENFQLKMLEDVIIEEAEQLLKETNADGPDKSRPVVITDISKRQSKAGKKVDLDIPYNDPEIANCVVCEDIDHTANKEVTHETNRAFNYKQSLEHKRSLERQLSTQEDVNVSLRRRASTPKEDLSEKFGLEENLLNFELKIVEEDNFEEEQRDEVPYELEIDFSAEDLPYFRVPIFRCTATGVPETVGYLKYVCEVFEEDEANHKNQLNKRYEWLVDQYRKTRDLIVRAYILQAKGLVPLSGATNISSYVWIKNSDQLTVLPGGISHNIRDSSNAKKQSFRPEFNKCYQLYCSLPDHALVKISIMILGTLTDECVGTTYIDMEDRFFNKKFQKMILEDATPIELRSLKNEGSSISHGTLRGWFELMNEDFAQKNPPHTMNITEPDDYELRIVIWRIKAVPLGDKSQISLLVKGLYQYEGGEGILRQTDVHYNSKDGCGVYNWRFLYDIKLPTRFTIFKFMIFSFDYLSTSENLGEVQLDLASDLFKAKQRASLYKIPKMWVSCSHGGQKGKFSGAIELEVSIVPRKEAELLPVGAGREEPNRDPFLPTVTENRTYIDWTAIGETITAAGTAILSGLKWTGIWLTVAVIIGVIIFIIILIK